MEQGFVLTKEMSLSWADVELMEARERLWLVERLYKWYEDRNREAEKSGGGARGGGGMPISHLME
jgi:hypothetical protein